MSIGLDQSLLAAALEGYEAQLARLNSQIAQVKTLLPRGKKTIDSPMGGETHAPMLKRRKRREVSEEGRQRMAEAQRRRWAAHRGETAA
ncbi:MAG TPA: hypothetical protein VFQ91_10485 [Bryobacteraceae bacterium]|nr:hypothetical protein [Bryobacteraceae bacterium]